MTPDGTEETALQDCMRKRAIGLFTYLAELAKLRTKVVRNVSEYEQVLWLSDIPKERECYTLAWHERLKDHEQLWLGVKKPRLYPCPPVPDELKPWVRKDDLAESSRIPNLLPRILAPESDDDLKGEQTEQGERPRFLELSDYPHLLALWKKYLDQKWLAWAKENERTKKIQRVYARLHAIYQQLKRQGEMVELTMGLGLLIWKTPTGQEVRRHLLAAEASVELDAQNGTLFVSPGPEGAKLTLEDEMLEAHERPDADAQAKIESQIQDIGDDIWGIEDEEATSSVEDLLRGWIYDVSAEGTYSSELRPPADLGSEPKVTFAPAIILRRRTERSLVTTYQKIIEQLQSKAEIPSGIRPLVKIKEGSIDINKVSDGPPKISEFKDMLLPRPSNEEQMRIIRALEQTQGVLVQGPPGTGKSHTIANLICHLLASGRRVLVTSQTPRALKVLKNMLPEDVRPLCVSLLGNDPSSLKDLEHSVEGITNRRYGWHPDANREKIDHLNRERDQLRRREADLSRRLREIRERETYEHHICEGKYRGTALRIAQRVSSERQMHGWLNAAIGIETDPPLSDLEALDFLRMHRQLTPDRVLQTQKTFVKVKELPSLEEFCRTREAELKAKAICERFSAVRGTRGYAAISNCSNEQLMTLKKALTALLNARDNVLKSSQPWAPKSVNDILSERDRVWRELLESTTRYLARPKKYARLAEETQTELPEAHSRSQIIGDAQRLIKHFENGGRLGWSFLRPRIVKETRYILKETRIDGRKCDTKERLSKLLAKLLVDDDLERLWCYWSAFVEKYEGNRSAQVAQLEDLCEPLEQLLNLHTLLRHASDMCMAIEGLTQPAWYNIEEVERYLHTVEAVESEWNLKNSKALFEKTEKLLLSYTAKTNTHPVVKEVHDALMARYEQGYRKALAKLEHLEGDLQLIERRQNSQNKLTQSAPEIAELLEAQPHLPDWDERMAHFVDSWRWAQARTWLDEYIAAVNEAEIVSELERIQEKILQTTAELAGVLAWQHCLERLSESQRMNLMAWKEAVKLIGKGTGKRAPIHRRDARKRMDEARSAIPAWIMPLYRVAETVNPSVDAYDVVIIDEASQSGPDALFLLTLADKIVVVGDNEQISPANVGIPLDDVDLLRDRYINDLPLKDALGLETSIFALAVIMYGNRIVLREHFRCMPEIIQFSNNLCYAHTPLEPLRQYPAQRLEPVIAVHVPDGYREGGNRTPLNRPEAEVIVNKIAECCRDPKYKGKTMGVISLLGEYQARVIERMLLEEIGPEEIERRNLVCGDAYAFQGDERDVMFLSMVAAPTETGVIVLGRAADRRRFNVAASRAKDQMWLFHTPTLNDFRNKECVRYKLLEYCLNPKPAQVDGSRDKCANDFEKAVYDKIVGRGYKVIPQFEVAGYFIDLVVEGMRARLAVECDGDYWHSEPEQRERDMQRQRVLERCGWTFWRVRGCEFYYDPDAALEGLWRTLELLEIYPDIGHQSTSHREKTELEESKGAVSDIQKQSGEGASFDVKRSSDLVRYHEPATPQPPEETAKSRQLRLFEESSRQPTLFEGHPKVTPQPSKQSQETKKKQKQTSKQPITAEDQQLIDWISTIPSDIWFLVAHWAKVNNILQPWERSLVFSIGKRVSRGTSVSVKQARHAHRVYHEALEQGFDEHKEKKK